MKPLAYLAFVFDTFLAVLVGVAVGIAMLTMELGVISYIVAPLIAVLLFSCLTHE